MNDRISIHPTICHGQACISGTRIPVHQIVRMFTHGDSIDTNVKPVEQAAGESVQKRFVILNGAKVGTRAEQS